MASEKPLLQIRNNPSEILRLSNNKLFTASESREIDRRTIEEFGIDGFTLMEIAATRATDVILEHYPSAKKALILSGKGNNGGDALAVARMLSEHGINCDICFVFGNDGLSVDTQKNYELLKKLSDNRASGNITEVQKCDPSDYDLVIDGMLGTGLNSDIKGELAELIEKINQAKTPVISMDIPTGIHGSEGKVCGIAVKADITCMFGTRKRSCYISDGPAYSGKRILCELPFPEYIMRQSHPVSLIDENTPLPELQKGRHKYDSGVVYIIGGSPGLTGAAILSAKAAWSAGCGAVFVFTPKGLMHAYDAHLVEQMRIPIGEEGDIYFEEKHIDSILEAIKQKPGTVLIGPGLGRQEKTVSFVEAFLSRNETNVVIDADGIYALLKGALNVLNKKSKVIITPHPGELYMLFNSKERLPESLMAHIQTCKHPENITILSKGMPCFVTSAKETHVTGYDTRPFSRAGFGDVLAGKTAAFFSMGDDACVAAQRALINGRLRFLEMNKHHPISPTDLL